MRIDETIHAPEIDEDDEGEMWAEYRKERREKRWSNDKKSFDLLTSKGFQVETLNGAISHYRVDGVNFWGTTGTFYDQKNEVKGRGVFNFIKYLKNKKK